VSKDTHLDMFEDVLEFHRKFQRFIGTTPILIKDSKLCALRSRLVQEEYFELSNAVADQNLEEIADAITDLIYVLMGMAITYGIDIRKTWKEVHKSNMQKEGGAIRKDGKILKPTGWEPPKIAKILAEQEDINHRRP